MHTTMQGDWPEVASFPRSRLGLSFIWLGTPGSDKESSMRCPTVHVTEHTWLPVEDVLAAATDFSERRATLWPDVHVDHFEVHEVGARHAEVTEGNQETFGFIWERLRYDWSKAGRVHAVVMASNVFHPGSTWELRASREGERTRVEIIGNRNVKGVKGAILGVIIWLGIGHRVVASHLRHFLAVIEVDIVQA